MDFNFNYLHHWETDPGSYSQEIFLPHSDLLPAFRTEIYWVTPTCIRYFNPTLLKDGRQITAVVEEEGTPGEPGWVWRFYVTEPVEGLVTWKVETRDCPKVS